MDASTGGNDVLDARTAKGSSFLYGDGYSMSSSSVGGKDTLWASQSGDTLSGDASAMQSGSEGGNDVIYGNRRADRIFGDAETMNNSSAGNDILRGAGGNDRIFGDATTLAGGSTGGNDSIEGGAGNDTLWGDGLLTDGSTGGQDRFIFKPGFGNDFIEDFRLEDGDLIVMRNGIRKAEVTISATADETHITVTYQGVTSDITLANYHDTFTYDQILFA